MDREDVWDSYYGRLHSIISSARGRIEEFIGDETRKEFLSRWRETNDEVINAYAEAAVSFIEERLFAYGMNCIDRFLAAAARGISPEDLASIEISASWYDWRPEKAEIDAEIEKGLNTGQSGDEIAAGLLRKFGAFPDKTIINAYNETPAKNHAPDYALALALERITGGEAGSG